MCQTALANLMYLNDGKIYFSKEKDIIPFLEENWEALTTQPKKTLAALNPSIHKALVTFDCIFQILLHNHFQMLPMLLLVCLVDKLSSKHTF